MIFESYYLEYIKRRRKAIVYSDYFLCQWYVTKFNFRALLKNITTYNLQVDFKKIED